MTRFGVVIVTYNRREKLQKTLSCYERQLKKIDTVIIVDNCSTDGTNNFLKKYLTEKRNFKVKILTMPKNIGGAGGFFEGMKHAMQIGLDWVYVSDDDAYIDNSTLIEIEKTYSQINDKDNVVALCSVVKNENGIDTGHRLRLKRKLLTLKWRPVRRSEYKGSYFEIDIFSYVGTAIRVNSLFCAGLDRKDFFIYHDDQEHSLRLRKIGKILTCTKSIIFHDTNPIKNKKIFWGSYYNTRNNLIMIKNHFPQRYYYIRYYLGYLRDCILCRDKIKRIMMRSAYHDAKKQIMDINEVYNPSWEYKEI